MNSCESWVSHLVMYKDLMYKMEHVMMCRKCDDAHTHTALLLLSIRHVPYAMTETPLTSLSRQFGVHCNHVSPAVRFAGFSGLEKHSLILLLSRCHFSKDEYEPRQFPGVQRNHKGSQFLTWRQIGD